MTHLKVAFEWVAVFWMFAVLLSTLAFIPLILMSIQPWLSKIKMVGGKGLKLLGWWLAIGVGTLSVVVLVAGGWPFANCLLMAGLYGVMAIAVHWIGECTIKGARKRQEGNGSDQP
jgi:hypothetical protein